VSRLREETERRRLEHQQALSAVQVENAGGGADNTKALSELEARLRLEAELMKKELKQKLAAATKAAEAGYLERDKARAKVNRKMFEKEN
jgi:hypothetical protein